MCEFYEFSIQLHEASIVFYFQQYFSKVEAIEKSNIIEFDQSKFVRCTSLGDVIDIENLSLKYFCYEQAVVTILNDMTEKRFRTLKKFNFIFLK